MMMFYVDTGTQLTWNRVAEGFSPSAPTTRSMRVPSEVVQALQSTGNGEMVSEKNYSVQLLNCNTCPQRLSAVFRYQPNDGNSAAIVSGESPNILYFYSKKV